MLKYILIVLWEIMLLLADNTILFAGVRVYSETEIGNDCTIHSGAIIGSDGFGFAPNEEGVYSKIPQIGNVIIEDNVDIGACTTIDRATLGSTIIKKGVKLDNQIQIAHNVVIGENTVIASQTGIAGSTKIGNNCIIGGQVGIVGHITIGNDVRIQAQSGVGKNIPDGEIIQGSPALGYSDFNKSYVHFKNLPKIVADIDELKQQIQKINRQIMVKQTTIKSEISLKGVGLHTGKEVTMTFKPAPANNGYTFVRVDLEGQPIVEADANYVVNTQRGTNLEKKGVKIQTSEHVLAAFVGCDVDNVIIELDASEPPIMDGSSKFFVEAIEKAGVEELDAERKVYVVKEVISYTDETTGSEILVMPSDDYQVTAMVDFGTKVLGTQNATLKNIDDFKKEIA